jgi:hypothetical protein
MSSEVPSNTNQSSSKPSNGNGNTTNTNTNNNNTLPSRPPRNNNNNNNKRGVDVLLTARGKGLQTGESVTFRLVKGPPVQTTVDPVDPKASESFPLVAKFPESVVRPDFGTTPWNGGRLYQQDIPKPVDDSDEEVSAEPKKRWKYNRRRTEAPKRQWILQEQVDFLETMVSRREKVAVDGTQISSRYEGVPEHNSSRYSLFLPMPAAAPAVAKNSMEDKMNRDMDMDSTNSPNDATKKDNDMDMDTIDTLQVCLLPSQHGVVNFAQPASRQTLSLTQAEQVIEDQRAGIRVIRPNGDAVGPGDKSGKPPPVAPMLRIPRSKPVNNSKSRLLNKLKGSAAAAGGNAGGNAGAGGNDEEEGDDVMGDLAFRKGKSGRSARKELLSDLGDGVKVSDDGVIGGTDDAAFGGRQRFGNFQADKPLGDDKGGAGGDDDDNGAGAGGGDSSGVKQERGGDGAAMADDFYSRDVQAEYEELDYDANEQFDDDDVDIGETEVAIDTGGYGDEDEEDEFEEFDLDQETVAGAAGLASVAGFKAMLAKARGEISAQPTAEEIAAAADKETDGKRAASPNSPPEKQKVAEEDHMAKIMAADERSAQAATERAAQNKDRKAATAASQVQVDANGLRIVTLEALRREIWLHHGKIPMKRLMKIFEVKTKSSPDRQNKFREVVKELCTMNTDPIGGRMLVLKQHYSNM